MKPATVGELRAAWMESEESPVTFVTEEMSRDDHGYGYRRIFRRAEDDTYWEFHGVSQNGGEYDSLRDDYKDSDTTGASRVEPRQVTRTVYRTVPPVKPVTETPPFWTQDA